MLANSNLQQAKPFEELNGLKTTTDDSPSAVVPQYARTLDSALFGEQSSALADLRAKSDDLDDALLPSHTMDPDQPVQVPGPDRFFDDIDALVSEPSHLLDHHPSTGWLEAVLQRDLKSPAKSYHRKGDDEDAERLEIFEIDDDAV